jgi:HAD superfamily hydrolase (TIGR01459 family)
LDKDEAGTKAVTEIIPSLSHLAGRYDAVFCDLWGCLHDGRAPFPAAVAALRAFRAGGGAVVLVTNAPRPKSAVVAQLDAMGLPRDAWDDVATSGDAAQAAMLMGAVGPRVHHIGAPKDAPFFTDIAPDIAALGPVPARVAMDQATGIVCTGLFDDLTETPEDYRAALLLGKTLGLPMLCANPDIVVDLGDRRLWCAGALAREYEALGGRALYFGKPHPPVYDLARRRLAALRPGEPQILCIGDGIATDIQGGMAEGLDTLYVTGGIDTAAFGPDPAAPDPVRLQAFLTRAETSATFAIGFLR